MSWKDFAEELVGTSKEAVKKVAEYAEDYRIYPRSIIKKGSSIYFMAKINKKRKLVILNKSSNFGRFQGEVDEMAGFKTKTAPLNHYNAVLLREIFQFTAPKTPGNKGASVGLGDCLETTAPAYIEAVKDCDVLPVFAQPSLQKLNLSGKTFKSILDEVSWSVFQEGYQNGFAADANNLKELSDIERVLNLGYSMVTLDCADYINNPEQMSAAEIESNYQKIPDYLREGLESQYLNKTFILSSGYQLEYNQHKLKKIILTYYKILDFSKEVQHLLNKLDYNPSLEISITKSSVVTTPEAHFFIANELKRKNIKINSLAPHFVGEFQNGIDYIGYPDKFEQQFKVHADIADRFGHKLSIHSASYKFSILELIGHHTQNRVHVKIEGTSCLEAVRIVAENEPALFRDIYTHALEKFETAKDHYYVNSQLNRMPALAQLTDQELVELLEMNEVRQLFYVTFGFILQAKENGSYLFKDKLYKVLEEHDKEYKLILEKQISKHLNKLGFYKN